MDATDHFTSVLPTKRVAADCLIFDLDGRFLVVRPTYKESWDIPGGVAEVDESLRLAAQREVSEEVGLNVTVGAMLAVDWVPRDGEVTEVVAYVFDGGIRRQGQSELTLRPDEISAARFVTIAEAAKLLEPEAHARVTHALAARELKAALYLENGSVVTSDH